jgi:glucosamine-6-phosphate deaminase
MSSLLAARHILLVVSGAHKYDILRHTVAGPITAEVPASFLQQAAHVSVIADRAAWHGASGV